MATFVPRPLLNIKVLFKSSTDVTDAICDIWRNTVDYMCGNHRTLRRIYIEKSIDLLDTKVSKLNGMISGSWWETCGGIGRCGRRWELIQAYSSNAVDFQDILFAVQSCAGKAKFSRRQIRVGQNNV
ncbi:unnamed protein product [Polarella glacialis]|uniref:Uncharacterized protein n=1 Tax=Polarella glacialis TaxID=89957 RepID=A0A813D2J5_POLGL|nr:unnamed protein product [Polarella glacialis]